MDEFLSHSRAYTYSKCRKAFSYKYLDKVQPKPGTFHLDSWERMGRGILIHAGMEAGFIGKAIDQYISEALTKRGPLSQEQQERFPKMAADAQEVVQAALSWLPLSDWEVMPGPDGKLMAEYRAELPLPGWKGFQGYIDLVARHKPTGAAYVIDYKTRTSFEREDVDQYNSQFMVYQKALAELGVAVVGSLLFELKPTPPVRAPRIVRDDSGNINGVRISADGRFRLTPTLRSKQAVNAYWEDFKIQAKVISEATPRTAYRSMSSFNCPSCEFEKLCMAELHGHDVKDVLERHYNVPREALRIVEEL